MSDTQNVNACQNRHEVDRKGNFSLVKKKFNFAKFKNCRKREMDTARKWLSEVTMEISEKLSPESTSDEKEASGTKIDSASKKDGKSPDVLTKGISKLLQDLKKLLDSEAHSDLTIDVKGKQFRVNRGIMAARSPVFCTMLTHDMKEKTSGVVDIQDIDPDVFPDFLEYVYTGRVPNLSSDNAQALFTAADKYHVEELREESLQHMKENVTVQNFCGVMCLSLRHNEPELTEQATKFFVENAQDIVKAPDWQFFMQENPAAANELFIKQIEAHNAV